MDHQQPHPEFVITMKDIYREASAFTRLRINNGMLDQADYDIAIREGLKAAQDVAKACGDPRNFTMSQELHILQNFMMEALQILEAVKTPPEGLDKVALEEAITDFMQRVETKLQVRRVTQEEVEQANARAAEFDKNTAGDESSDNVIKFGVE